MKKKGDNTPPITILIKPASGLCNLRCKYCFYADITKNREIKSYGITINSEWARLFKRNNFLAGLPLDGCRGGCKRDRLENFADNYYCKSLYNYFDYSIDRMKEIAGIAKKRQMHEL